uniref:BAI1 associated protein 3 n=1 Tax=Loxodonta africana TaxID=9785 RepID=G3SZM3_LOXAF
MSPEEVEMLYQEALYTVLHCPGTMCPDQVDDQDALLAYLSQLFSTSPEEHAEDVGRGREAKVSPAMCALKVSIMCTKNLLAKDPKGFSDPYCMLGILLASGTSWEPPRRNSASISGCGRDLLPAKCVQVTKVKSSTLSPVWKKHILFEIEDVSSDQLYLDICPQSLVDTCRKLNEVMGLKGMGRQIVKSALANGTACPTEDHTDDFLGCLNIPIREVPVVGEDRWFKLEPHSSEYHLVLKLITMQAARSGRGLPCPFTPTLLPQPVSSSWRGELSRPAATILSLHATQSNLSPLQLAVLEWQMCYSRQSPAWTGLVTPGTGKVFVALQGPTPQEEGLANSFSSSLFGLKLLHQLRDYFPATNSTAIYHLELLLKCLSKLQLFQPSFEICPFETELNMDVTVALKRGYREWYDKLLNAKSPRKQPMLQRLMGLIELADAVYEDLQACYGIYTSLFHSTLKVGFFTLTFRQLECLVAEETWVLMEELSPRMTLEVASGLFELYLTLADIQRFWSSIPGGWVPSLHPTAVRRDSLAVNQDAGWPEVRVLHEALAAAGLCFSHIQELWVHLAWPDPAQAQGLGTQLDQDMCEAALFYMKLLRKKVDTQPGATGEAMSEPLCVVLNDMELVHKAAEQALRGLAWPEGAGGPEGGLPRPLLSCMQVLDGDLQREVGTVTVHLTSEMVGDIWKYVQHVSLLPDSIQNDEAVAPLVKYLDEKLALLKASLMKENLASKAPCNWRSPPGPSLAPAHTMPMTLLSLLSLPQALVNFFHAKGQGLSLESPHPPSLQRLEEELHLHKCLTCECIEQFYLDKLKQRPMENRFGRLSVCCYYEAAEQRLVVEVLHAADLIPLDANGLSDLFVIMKLGPPHLFPLIHSQKTQVKARTLHPMYDELFHFSVLAEACCRWAACMLFTVMDHDWLSTNDFAGEAALGL